MVCLVHLVVVVAYLGVTESNITYYIYTVLSKESFISEGETFFDGKKKFVHHLGKWIHHIYHVKCIICIHWCLGYITAGESVSLLSDVEYVSRCFMCMIPNVDICL